jgi:hypothetical protein
MRLIKRLLLGTMAEELRSLDKDNERELMLLMTARDTGSDKIEDRAPWR